MNVIYKDILNLILLEFVKKIKEIFLRSKEIQIFIYDL
jgi:hypothetical protein